MAIYNVNLRILTGSKIGASAPTHGNVPDTPETFEGIIHPEEMIPTTVLGSPIATKWVAWDTTSDIAGYRKLRTAQGPSASFDLSYGISDTGGTYPEFTTLEEFATDTGGMDNVFANSVTTVFAATVWKDIFLELNDVFLEVYIYHRTASGTETLIASYEETVVDTSATQYTQDVTLTWKWAVNERLVIKYRFRNEGIPV
jgi:hypothetical protein